MESTEENTKIENKSKEETDNNNQQNTLKRGRKPSNATSSTAAQTKQKRTRSILEKAFICTEPGCDKRFTRSEHLVRHQLNHKPTKIYHCSWDACQRTFVREDLLIRHERRHQNRLASEKKQFASKPSPIGFKALAENPSFNHDNLISSNSNFNANNESLLLSSSSASLSINNPNTASQQISKISRGNIITLNQNENQNINQNINQTTNQNINQELNQDVNQNHNINAYINQSNSSTNTLVPLSQNDEDKSALQNPQFYSTPSFNNTNYGITSYNNNNNNINKKKPLDYYTSDTYQLQGPPEVYSTTANPYSFDRSNSNFMDDVNDSALNENYANNLVSWLFSDAMLPSNGIGANTSGYIEENDSLYLSLESPMSLPNVLSPPSMTTNDSEISEAKRLEILLLYPSLPSPDVSLNAIRQYISLYWTYFHPQFPILHLPSFSADETPDLLLWSIILIGAEYSQKHDLAINIAEPLRWLIFTSPGFNPPAQLHIIQSLLILEVYEKIMGPRKFHERAHIHHAATIQLVRRGTALRDTNVNNLDISDDTSTNHSNFSPQPSSATYPFLSQQTSANSSQKYKTDPWKKWIRAESWKRTTYMAFIIDVFHAILFNHSLILSVHEINIFLPCSDELWESNSPDLTKEKNSHNTQKFRRNSSDKNMNDNNFRSNSSSLFSGQHMILFRTALKNLLKHNHVETCMFGQLALLAGVVSLADQMRMRDLEITSLGWFAFPDQWRALIDPVFDSWMSNFQKQFVTPPCTPGHGTSKLPVQASNSSSPNNYTFGSDNSSALTNDSSSRDSFMTPASPPLSNVSSSAAAADWVSRGIPIPFAHLAHLLTRVNIHDVLIWAGAPTVLGRPISNVDYEASAERIKDWTSSIWARDATFHAHSILQQTYSVDLSAIGDKPLYSAAKDFVCHRTFCIFIAMVVVWTYGYVREGPESNLLSDADGDFIASRSDAYESSNYSYKSDSPSSQSSEIDEVKKPKRVDPTKLPAVESGYSYLTRLSSARNPDELHRITGKNRLVGLLRLVIASFDHSSWEILRESRRILLSLVERSLGRSNARCDNMFSDPGE